MRNTDRYVAQLVTMACIVALFVLASQCDRRRIPELSKTEATEIISRAPEFNRYARLLTVDQLLDSNDDSMAGVTYGKFTFQYLGAPADAPLIRGDLDFRYQEGKWHLNGFTYDCPGKCKTVHVYDGPDRRMNP
jgi:hypothetical protein